MYPVFGGNGLRGYTDTYNFDGECAIIGRQGAYCGNVKFFSGKGYMTEHAIVAVANHQNNTRFLSYKFALMDLGRYAGQSAQPGLSVETLLDVEIDVPSKSTQEAIANVLSTIDSKIENNNSICADLESMAKLLYDYWFVQFDFPDKKGKPYKSSNGKMVFNDELKREIPEGWGVTTIGSITKCHDSERIPVANKDRENMKGNIPYYGATGIMGYVNRAIFSGDYVLLAEDGSVMDEKGHPIIQRVSGNVWINNHAHVLEPIKGYSCRLLMMILKDIPVVNIKTGSIQMKINQENLNAYKIVEIPEPLIKKINDVLEDVDRKLLEIESENQQLTSLRDFLLPMLMNGQVKVKASFDKEE